MVGGLPGHIYIADPLAGKGEGFGIGIANHSVGVDAGNEADLGIAIHQFPVRFVGTDVNGVAKFCRFGAQQVSQLLQGIPGIYRAGGVVWGIDHDGGGVRRQHICQHIQTDLEVRHIRRNCPETQPGSLRKGLVFREKGGDGQNLCAGCCQGMEGGSKCRCGTGGEK